MVKLTADAENYESGSKKITEFVLLKLTSNEHKLLESRMMDFNFISVFFFPFILFYFIFTFI